MPSKDRTRMEWGPSERAEAFHENTHVEVPCAATSVPLSIETQTATNSLRSSEAEPLIVELAPTVSPSSGLVTETRGAAFGPRFRTMTPTSARAELPRSSTAVADRRCGPSVKFARSHVKAKEGTESCRNAAPPSAANETVTFWPSGSDADPEAGEEAGAEAAGTGTVTGMAALDPLADLVRVQRLAVAIAESKGYDPDKPRNLTRSVVLS